MGDKQHDLGPHETKGARGGGEDDRIPLGIAWGDQGAAEEITRGGSGGSHGDKEEEEESSPVGALAPDAGGRRRRGRRGFRHRRRGTRWRCDYIE